MPYEHRRIQTEIYRRFIPGWDAITARLSEVYGDQQPKHWGSVVKYALGGTDPIDGMSVYRCNEGGADHLHFVTYGYSALYYDQGSVGQDFSGFGFEMTFRLRATSLQEEEATWVWNMLQNLARYVFRSQNCFDNYHWIPGDGPIRAGYASNIVGLAFVHDPVLKSIDSPHGRVDFIQAFGITTSELAALKNNSRTCEEIIEHQRKSNPLLITDLDRTS